MSGLPVAKSLELDAVRPALTRADLDALCEIAVREQTAAFVTFPAHVARAASVLRGSDTKLCAVVGFPYGQETAATKRVAVEEVRNAGADEVAIVLDHAAVAAGDVEAVRAELEPIVRWHETSSLISTRGLADLTVVLESSLIPVDVLRPVLESLADLPVAFLATSSGMVGADITAAHIQNLRSLTPESIAIKAVGAIHTLADTHLLLSSGAVRVGTISAGAIAQEDRLERTARTNA